MQIKVILNVKAKQQEKTCSGPKMIPVSPPLNTFRESNSSRFLYVIDISHLSTMDNCSLKVPALDFYP